METVLNVFLLVLGFAMLAKGADWFVDGAAAIATKLKIPQIVIGLTIVAMGTSAPEAAVSISAAFGGNADITVGNIVGSNILNILIILGLASLIIPIAVARSVIRIDMPFMIAITGLLLLLGYDGEITHIDGLIFTIVFAAYLTYLFIDAKKNNKSDEKKEEETTKEMPIFKASIFTVVGLAIIILGSNFTVDSATFLAKEIGVNDRIIGLTVVALGTSLPELFTSVVAARKGNADIAIGNVVGSNIFNILFVVGISSLITEVPFPATFIFDIIIAISASILLWVFSLKGKIKRWMGIVLLAGYAAYFVKILLF